MEIVTADTIWRVNLRHRVKFRADVTIRCQDTAIFRFSKMAAVRHVGFLNVQNFYCL